MMSGRLEYRVFGHDLAEQRTALTTRFRSLGSEKRSDLYFAGPHHSLSYKLRDDATLDLKALVGCKGKLEHWEPRGQCNLPATGKALKAAFQDGSNLPALRPGVTYHAPDLTEEFVRNGCRTVLVRKSRTRFAADTCLAEITGLTTDTCAKYWTVAIEGRNAGDLDRLVSKLGLKKCENQSYPAWIIAQVSSI